MKLPRIRYTVRRMMVAVAVVGVSTGGWIEASRLASSSKVFRGRASSHRFEEVAALKMRDRLASDLKRAASERSVVDLGDFQVITGPPLEPLEKILGDYSRRVEFHRIMREKYEHAARYPWLRIAPDPPYPG